MKKTLFLILALFLVFSFSGVTAQEKAKKEKKEKTTNVVKKEQAKKATSKVTEEKLVCPVMKMDAKKEINYTYKGKKYYFCCKDCLAKFKANPEKYTKK